MANLTQATLFDTISRGFQDSVSIIATNAIQFYAGGLVFVDNATGRVVKPADTATFRFLGIVKKDVLGNTAATPPTEVEVNCSGETMQRVTVATVASQADVGDLVYIGTTDNPNDMTRTATANTKACGVITRWYSGTTCDVKLFTKMEHDALF